jgi:hypothetical protein
MRQARGLTGLLAGLLLFDFLVNLPGFSLSSPVGSLLVPSIDLLVIVAACMGIARAGERAKFLLRVAVAVFAVGLLVCSAGLRFGFGVEAHLFRAGSVGGVAAGWAVSLVLPAAVLQVVSGRRLFSASVIPRLIAFIGSQSG